jgi:hypothetical protein
VKLSLRPDIAGAMLVFLLSHGSLQAATIEVQGVAASNPGDKDKAIPATLEAFKPVLKSMPFKTFKDLGHNSVTAAAGGKGSANVGGYNVEITVTKSEKGKSTVSITLTDNGKAIGEPTTYELATGQARQMKIGDANAPKILFFTLKE